MASLKLNFAPDDMMGGTLTSIVETKFGRASGEYQVYSASLAEFARDLLAVDNRQPKLVAAYDGSLDIAIVRFDNLGHLAVVAAFECSVLASSTNAITQKATLAFITDRPSLEAFSAAIRAAINDPTSTAVLVGEDSP